MAQINIHNLKETLNKWCK